jgi:ATP phosphoribosyltransferase
VETGKTLYENHLAPFEKVVDISARLIANKASFKFKNGAIENIYSSLAKIVK